MKSLFLAVALAAALGDTVLAAPKNPPADLATVRVVIRKANDRATAARFGNTLEDYGSYVLLRISPRALERARAFGLDAEIVDERIGMGAYRFDPERSSPAIPDGLAERETGPDPRYYIVQFRGPIRDEWVADARRSGVEPVQYVPENALIVRATPAQMAVAGRGPAVRWSGLFHPAYKLSRDLEWLINEEVPRTQSERQYYRVGVFRGNDLAKVSAAIKVLGGTIDQVHELDGLYFHSMRVAIDTARISDLAALREICRIETWTPNVAEDERSNQIVAGNYTSTTAVPTGYASFLSTKGVNGTGITVGVVDDGVDVLETHLTGRVTDTVGLRRGASAGAYGHGHHDAGIIAGFCTHTGPGGFFYGSGMAPAAHVLNIPMLRGGYSGSEIDSQRDIVATAAGNGQTGTVSSNSWGSGFVSTTYGTREASFDALVHDAASDIAGQQPLAIIFSAGNSGTSGLTSPKAAKNILVVGASENLRPDRSGASSCGTVDANNLDQVACFSSRGPAADGRIRPDVLAPGTWIASALAGTDTLWGNIDASHRYCTGTSQACPHVAGATALIQQWWKSTHGGALPAPALSKAMIINGAVDPAPVTSIPNNTEGWGRMNLANTIDSGVPTIYNNQQDVLTDAGQTYSIGGSVVDASKPFRVTLVWSDAPGAAGANPALVNNLDLEVTIGGVTYKGNVFTNGISTAGGTADTRNNVEAVYFPAGTATGSFTVTVRATSVSGDGARGTGDTTDQHFALVVYNGATCTAVAAPSPTAATNGNSRIDVSWSAVTNATSYKVFRATQSSGPFTQVATPAASPYVDLNVTSFQTYYYIVHAYGSCESGDSEQDSATATGVLTPPAHVVSVLSSSTSTTLNWSPAPGALSYRVFRMANNGAYADIGTTATTFFVDPTLSANAAYIYKVRSVRDATESGDSMKVLATTVLLDDRNLVANTTPVRAIHFSQVRQAVQLVHNLAGPDGTLALTDPVLTTATMLKRAHLTELRTYLNTARVALGMPALVYSDPTPGTLTAVRAVHLTELRLGAGTGFLPPPVTSQILLNPGFELGAVNWVHTGVISNIGSNQRSGAWKAWLNGTGYTNTDWIEQQITIPAAASAATLTFWLNIYTEERTTITPYDQLRVQVINGNGQIQTLATYSNVQQTGGAYEEKTFDLLQFAGQTITVRFYGTEDYSLATGFLIDDTAVTVTQQGEGVRR